MIITVSRSGGFTGITLQKTLNTKKVSPEIGERLEELIFTSQFFKQSSSESTPSDSRPLPDKFSYRITMQDEVTEKTIAIPEHALTDEIKELIQLLEQNEETEAS